MMIESEFEELRKEYLNEVDMRQLRVSSEAMYISIRLYQALFEKNDLIQKEDFLAEIETDIRALELEGDDKYRADILAAALLNLPSFLKVPSDQLNNIKDNAKKASSIRHEKSREIKQKAKVIWLEWQEDQEMFKSKAEFARHILKSFKDEKGKEILSDDKNIKDVWIKEWEAEKQHRSA